MPPICGYGILYFSFLRNNCLKKNIPPTKGNIAKLMANKNIKTTFNNVIKKMDKEWLLQLPSKIKQIENCVLYGNEDKETVGIAPQ